MRGAPLKNSRQDSILSSISRTLVDRNLAVWNTAIRDERGFFFDRLTKADFRGSLLLKRALYNTVRVCRPAAELEQHP